jgi:hypothetical protein
VTLEDRRACVREACKILRVAETAGYVALAMGKLARLLKDDVTVVEALEVVRYARTEYDAGDRFKQFLSLVYVWSVRNFTPLQAAARTTPSAQKEYSVMKPGPERDDWHEGYREKLRKRGLLREQREGQSGE